MQSQALSVQTHQSLSGRAPSLPPLTSLRYWAAVGVVCLHSGKFFGMEKGTMRDWGIYNLMGFFFILSGFIIFYTHPTIENAAERKKFYVQRFARIYPLFLVTFLASIVLIPHAALFEAAHETWQIVVAVPLQLTLTQSWLSLPGFDLIFNAVAWSISCEAFFYLVFPFILKSFRREWKKWLLGTYLITAAVMVIVDLAHLPWNNEESLGLSAMVLFHCNPLVRLSEFVLGMALAFALERRRVGQRSFVELKLTTALATMLEVFALTFLLVSLRTAQPISNWVQANWSIGLGAWIMHSGITLASALTIFTFSLNKGLVSRLLSLRFLVLLGEISYSLYLWHNIFFLRWREGTGLPLAHVLPVQFRFAFFMTALSIGSYLSFRLIEKPGKDLVMRTAARCGWIEMRTPRAASAVSPVSAPTLQTPRTGRHRDDRQKPCASDVQS